MENVSKYHKYLDDTPPPPDTPPGMEGYWATRCVLDALMPIIKRLSHVFVTLAGRSLGLAMIGKNVLPSMASPCTCLVSLHEEARCM